MRLIALGLAAALSACGHTTTSLQYIDSPKLLHDDSFTNVVKAGRTVYVTAQLPVDTEGNLLATDPEGQVRAVWHNVDIALHAAGGSLRDVVACTTYITDAKYFPVVREVRIAQFPHTPPTTSRPILVNQVTALPGVGVSISVIAVLPD